MCPLCYYYSAPSLKTSINLKNAGSQNNFIHCFDLRRHEWARLRGWHMVFHPKKPGALPGVKNYWRTWSLCTSQAGIGQVGSERAAENNQLGATGIRSKGERGGLQWRRRTWVKDTPFRISLHSVVQKAKSNVTHLWNCLIAGKYCVDSVVLWASDRLN